MNISHKFKEGKTVYSFEVFPPKSIYPIDTVYDTLDALGDLSPDYISVTYGAGGSLRENRTVELSKRIKDKLKIEPLAHLTCIASTRADIDEMLISLRKNGVQNILALRGDLPLDAHTKGDFNYAADLIGYIKEKSDFNVVAACYPEKHLEAKSMDEDLNNLKNKVSMGVGHLVTQLFFDNNNFYDFMDKAVAKGINVPVTAGIMPVVNRAQIEKMVNMCGATIPKNLKKIIEKYGDDKVAMRDAGILYAAGQISDLIANGVAGVHIYTMNNPAVARKISRLIDSLIGE